MTAMSGNGKTTVQAAPASRTDLHRPARHQLMGLSAQFLLGMAVNLIGLPSQTTGAAHVISTVLLVLHVVVAIALVAGAIMLIRTAAGGGNRPRQLARWGAILIGLTLIAGVMTMITTNNWWSYVMAVGFIAAMLLYGSLLVGAGQPRHQTDQG
jgi:hypothetical protein